MSWSLHIPGQDPELDKVLARRFGRDHNRPCENPNILTCAIWECQRRGICRLTIERSH